MGPHGWVVQPTRQIVIDPVTRIEGHSRITLHLNEQGAVPSRARRPFLILSDEGVDIDLQWP